VGESWGLQAVEELRVDAGLLGICLKMAEIARRAGLEGRLMGSGTRALCGCGDLRCHTHISLPVLPVGRG
jgi:hypothetical protein